MPLAIFIVLLGADASTEVLRHRARCTACGRRGATLTLPS
jgi:hypothetical protein